jgi:hypothetical protein
MNETTWERLVWKEHRMLRGLWVAAVVLCGLVLFAMAWQMKSTGDPTLFFQVAMGIGACYALGCGAEAFAGEREARTDLFQSALPASGRQLLIAKSSHAALSALALLVVLWCLAWLAVGAWLRDFSGTLTLGLEPAVLGVVTTVQLLAWATLFSLRSTSPLWVVVWAFAFNALTTYPVAWLFGDIPEDYRTAWYFPSLLGDLPSALPRLVIAAAVGYGCWRWATHWTREEGQPSRWRLRRWESLDRFAAGLLNRFEGWPRWQRLMWQQWQSAQWYLVAIALLYAVFVSAAMIAAPTFELSTWTIPFLLICSLFGTGVFHFDHRLQHVRFLSEHGVTPRILWWARQSFWFTLFAGCGLIVFVFAMLATKGLEWTIAYDEKGYVPFYFFAALSFYGAGQWASLWVRSAILRIVVNIGLCLTLTCWLLLMLLHRVPMWWSTGVIPLALLGASRLGMRDWMRDQIGKRPRRIQFLALAVPTIAVLAGVIVYRWTEIPRATPQFTLAPRTEEECAAASAKGAEYLLAAAELDVSALRQLTNKTAYDESPKDDANPAEYERMDWGPEAQSVFERNEPAVRKLLAVTPGPYAISAAALASEAWRKGIPPTKSDYYRTQEDFWAAVAQTRMFALPDTLMLSAEKHEQDGDLGEALRRYLCALELIVNQQPDGAKRISSLWESYPQVMRRLQRWAGEPGQSAEMIRQAIREVAKPVDWIEHEERVIERRYRLGRASLEGDEEAFAELCGWWYYTYDEAIATRYNWTYRLLPWERWRALRRLNADAAAESRELANVRATLQRNEYHNDGIAKENGAEWRRSPTYSIVEPDAWRNSNLYRKANYGLESITLNQRATLIILALEGWALEHGALPDTLEQLVPDWLDAAPIDPLTGKPFLYFPTGVDTTLRWRMRNVNWVRFVLPAGWPFLFSGSAQDWEVLKTMAGGPFEPTFLLFAIPVRKTEPSP